LHLLIDSLPHHTQLDCQNLIEILGFLDFFVSFLSLAPPCPC
jgi:hypothetical protein